MGVNTRSSIMADIPGEIQTGDPPGIKAIESYNIQMYSLVIAAPIPSLSVVNVYLFPPTGAVSQVKALSIKAPAVLGASASTHSVEVFVTSDIGVLRGTSTYNSTIEFTFSYWKVANSDQQPTQEISQSLALNRLVGNTDRPVWFKYTNNTFTIQTRDITIDVLTREGIY